MRCRRAFPDPESGELKPVLPTDTCSHYLSPRSPQDSLIQIFERRARRPVPVVAALLLLLPLAGCGDKYIDYQAAVTNVAAEQRQETEAKTRALTILMQSNGAESPEATAYKTAMGVMALAMMESRTPESIEAIHYGRDGYDVAYQGAGIVGDIMSHGILAWGGVEIVKAVGNSAGDTTSITGDRNSIAKTQVQTEIHANTTGNESPPSVTTDPSAVHTGTNTGTTEDNSTTEAPADTPVETPAPVAGE